MLESGYMKFLRKLVRHILDFQTSRYVVFFRSLYFVSFSWSKIDILALGRLDKFSAALANNKTIGVSSSTNIFELNRLYGLAKKVRRGHVIVELGSWQGKSTAFIAMGSKSRHKSKVYAIDVFEIDPERGFGDKQGIIENGGKKEYLSTFKRNMKLAGVDKLVIPIKCASTDQKAIKKLKNKRIGMIFLDGDHTYDGVKNDLETWLPKLSKGAIVAFHDYNHLVHTGVKKCVNEYVASGKLKFVSLNSSLAETVVT